MNKKLLQIFFSHKNTICLYIAFEHRFSFNCHAYQQVSMKIDRWEKTKFIYIIIVNLIKAQSFKMHTVWNVQKKNSNKKRHHSIGKFTTTAFSEDSDSIHLMKMFVERSKQSRTPDHGQERKNTVVWLHLKIFWHSKDDPSRHSKRQKKMSLTK